MSLRVPSKDYAAQYDALWPELGPELERTFRTDNPILGHAVAEFEREFAEYLGVRHVVGVGSGTDALILALRALGTGPGDEVVVPANTFAATVTAVLMVGARPVLVDPDPRTLTLDASGVSSALGVATKVIVPVHLYGRLCDMAPLVELGSARGIAIVEDAAQAHGARAGTAGRCAGSFGRFGCFSFHPSKNLGAFGDGGAISTDDDDMAATLRELRNLGKRSKYGFAHVAPNSKLDTLQATILRVKLRHLDRCNARRRAIAAAYAERLRPLADRGCLTLPAASGEVADDARHVYHLYPVHTDGRDERDGLRRFLKEHGISAGLHYPIPPHLQEWPAGLSHREGDFPIAEASARRELSLPIAPELADAQVAFVAENVHAYFTE